MTIEKKYSKDKKVLVISVYGKFDFALVRGFRQSYMDDEAKSAKIVVDLRHITIMDSSALGMLLNMQEYLQKSDNEISIINCSQAVLDIFNITHFDKKFNIE